MVTIIQKDLKYVKDSEGVIRFLHGSGYAGGTIHRTHKSAGELAVPKGWNGENFASGWIPCDKDGNEVKIIQK